MIPRKLLLAALGGAVGLALLGLVLDQRPFYLDLAVLTLIFAFAGCAWNIVGGYQNQLALGHSAYFAIGAYASSLLYVERGVSPWLGMFAGFGIAAAIAAALAALVIRLRTAFYALATVAFAEVVRIVLIRSSETTGGSGGLTIPYKDDPANFIFADRLTYYFVFAAAVVLLVSVTAALENGRRGRQSRALSFDEEAAASLGVRLFRLKVGAAALSGGLTAIAGTFYAQYLLYLTPDRVAGLDLAIEIPLIAVLGGVARSWGPVLGAAVLIPGTGLLRSTLSDSGLGSDAPAVTGMVYGLILIGVLLVAPLGLADALSRARRRLALGRRRDSAHARV